MNFLPPFFKWFFVNILLAILPLIATFFIVLTFKEEERRKWTWVSLFKNGELFFFSSAISASAISDLSSGRDTSTSNLTTTQAAGDYTITLISLIFILLLSTIMFGSSAYLNLQSQIFKTQSSPIDERRFAYGSVFCAITAAILGYIAFIQKGT
jgi:hypothetical protein